MRIIFLLVSFLWVSLCLGSAHPHANAPASPSFPCDVLFPEAMVSNINTIYIPFTLVGRLMIVQANIDTFTGNFIVDTGSERLLLNQDYVPFSGRERMITAVGNTGTLSVKEKLVDSLYLDQLYVTNVMAHLVDLNHIEVKKNTRILGILGYNVFEKFELFIDFQNKLIVLSRVDKRGTRLDSIAPYELPYDSMSFDLKKHLIVVSVIINGVRTEMILDSGAELNLIDRSISKRVLGQFTIIKRVNLIGVGKHQVEVLAGTINQASCGNQEAKNMNTLLTSLDEINSSFGVSVEGVLGYEFLNSRRTLINYQKRKLYFFRFVRT